MNPTEIINLVTSSSVTIRVEVSSRVVAARKDRKAKLLRIIMFTGRCLGATDWALLRGPTNVEAVVVCREGLQTFSLNLDCEVNVAGGVCFALTNHSSGDILLGRDLVLDADGAGRRTNITLSLVRVQRHSPRNGDVRPIILQLR